MFEPLLGLIVASCSGSISFSPCSIPSVSENSPEFFAMTLSGWLQIALILGLVALTTRPLGLYMARVFSGERTFLSPVLRPVERGILLDRPASTPEREQHWLTYTVAMLLFQSAVSLILYAIMRLQAFLPFNPAGQSRRRAGSRLQHRDQLHHQHQLAELWRREHDVLSRRRCWA